MTQEPNLTVWESFCLCVFLTLIPRASCFWLWVYYEFFFLKRLHESVSLDKQMIHSWFHIFGNVPGSWGALGLRAQPLFTLGGGVQAVRDASCSITKGGRCGDKTRSKMLDSVTIRWWMVKSSAKQFLQQQWDGCPPPTGGRTTKATISVNWPFTLPIKQFLNSDTKCKSVLFPVILKKWHI